MTSDWCMTSNIPKNKIRDGFWYCALLKNKEFIFIIFSWSCYRKFTFQKTRALSEIRYFQKIVHSSGKSLWNRKMTECTPSTLFYCSADHVGSETESMDRYKLMCRMHVLMYLFPDARDDMFLTYHYHVGIYKLIYKWWYFLGRN